MAVLALADALPDFGAARHGARQPGDARAAGKVQPGESEAERLARAIADAEAALTERLAREHQEKLAAERERHAAEIEATVASLGEKAADAIARGFADIENRIVSVLSAHAARILGVALTDDLQQRAVDEMERILREAIADRGAMRIRVRGTALLIDTLREKLGEHAGRVDFVEADGFDLTAEIDESLFETRIAEWSATLSEILS